MYRGICDFCREPVSRVGKTLWIHDAKPEVAHILAPVLVSVA